EDALQCGTHIPKDRKGYEEHIRKGGTLTPVFSNCSGKHSGMLATAIHMNEDTDTYFEVEHPVQQRIIDVIADICDTPKEDITLSVDGCGVPVHLLPLRQAAYGFARLAQPGSDSHDDALKRIRDAMIAYPERVAGTDRF